MGGKDSGESGVMESWKRRESLIRKAGSDDRWPRVEVSSDVSEIGTLAALFPGLLRGCIIPGFSWTVADVFSLLFSL